MRASEMVAKKEILNYVTILVDEEKPWESYPQDEGADVQAESVKKWTFGLKYLSGTEKDQLQNAGLETRAMRRRKGRGVQHD